MATVCVLTPFGQTVFDDGCLCAQGSLTSLAYLVMLLAISQRRPPPHAQDSNHHNTSGPHTSRTDGEKEEASGNQEGGGADPWEAERDSRVRTRYASASRSKEPVGLLVTPDGWCWHVARRGGRSTGEARAAVATLAHAVCAWVGRQ